MGPSLYQYLALYVLGLRVATRPCVFIGRSGFPEQGGDFEKAKLLKSSSSPANSTSAYGHAQAGEAQWGGEFQTPILWKRFVLVGSWIMTCSCMHGASESSLSSAGLSAKTNPYFCSRMAEMACSSPRDLLKHTNGTDEHAGTRFFDGKQADGPRSLPCPGSDDVAGLRTDVPI